MEWVETTGKTVEEAKDAALDQLGVDEQDAEFEVLEEAKSGLFGRLRTEARVRARIRPTKPRAKVERRDRKRRPAAETSGGDDHVAAAVAAAAAAVVEAEPPTRTRRPAAGGRTRPTAETADESPARSEGTPVESRSIETQQEALQAYFEGVLEAFDLDGRVEVVAVDDDTLEARLDGDDLGLLIGPKGATLNALQDLARSSVQRPGDLRFRVDVGGYRERRRVALERFTRQLAEQVLETGTPTSLEPMNAADRKVVHDTANTIDGVQTSSEGEDPRRRVVISPAD